MIFALSAEFLGAAAPPICNGPGLSVGRSFLSAGGAAAAAAKTPKTQLNKTNNNNNNNNNINNFHVGSTTP